MASFWCKYFGIGCHKPTPVPPAPQPITPRFLRTIGFVVYGTNGPLEGASVALDFGAAGQTITLVTNGDGYAAHDIDTAQTTAQLNVTAAGYKPYSVSVDITNHNVDLVVGGEPRPDQVACPALEPLVIARKGIVRADGRNFRDDDGLFYPLGATLFWSLRGWKFEQERLKKNLTFLMSHRTDYVRILAEVGWAGNDIRPDWPDYDQIFTEFVDYCYDVCGMRVEVTLVGGGTPTNYVAFASRIASLIKGREHKILDLEVANEAFQNLTDTNVIKQMCRILRDNTPCLVAATSFDSAADSRAASADSMSWGCNMATTHMDRSNGDEGWRAIRQPWDWKGQPFPVSHNEPIGPLSSVAFTSDGSKLAMLRATGIICGVGAFVLHNGAGVAGVIDTVHNRPANLYEVPGIDAIMETVRNVDLGLRDLAADGNKYGPWWAGNPLPPAADMIWRDGHPNGVSQMYVSDSPNGWTACFDGIRNFCVVIPRNSGRLALFSPMTKTTTYMDVVAGQPTTITPTDIENGYGSFIIRQV